MTIFKEEKSGILVVDGKRYIQVERTIKIFRRVREAEQENLKLKTQLKNILHEMILDSNRKG